MSRGTAEQVMGQFEKLQRQKQNVSAWRYSLCGKKRRKCWPLRKVAFSVSRRKSWQKTSSTCIRCGASRDKKYSVLVPSEGSGDCSISVSIRYYTSAASAYVITRQHTSTYVNVCLQNSSISVSIRQHRRGQELSQPHVVFSWCFHALEQTVENYWTQVTTIVATHGWPTTHNFRKFEGPVLNCRGRTPPVVVCV